MQSFEKKKPEVVVQRLEETAQISKRVVDTGKGVRVQKRVREREEVVDQPVTHDELTVERVPIDRLLIGPDLPVTRQEGDTTVVPVLEEVLVVEKRVRLKEEVRITRRRREVAAPQTVRLKSEEVSVERFNEE